MTAAPLILVAGRILGLAAVSAVLAESAARVGAGLLPLGRSRPADPLARLGIGLMLGWTAAGTALLGLALTGLFSAPAIAAASFALLLGSRATYRRLPMLLEAAGELALLGRLPLLVLGLGFAALAAFALVPEFHIDSDIYHLGAPWQFLQNHRILLDHVPVSFRYPLPVDLTFAMPILLGDDRIARWIVVSWFAAANAVFVSHCRRRGLSDAAWLGVLLAISAGDLFVLAATSKNDIPAAALFVAGAIVFKEGRHALGAVLLGACVAAKMVYAPFAVFLLLLSPPPRRTWGWLIPGFILPIAPWLVKNLLASGNPLFPFASTWIPTLDWGELNRAGYLFHAAPLSLTKDALITPSVPRAWLHTMGSEHFLLLISLPGLALLGRDRRLAWACVLASIAILFTRYHPRYAAPATWVFSLLVAVEVSRSEALRRRGLVVLLAAYAAVHLGLSPELRRPGWSDMAAPFADVMRRNLTTQQEAIEALGFLRRLTGASGPLGRAPAFRVVSIGEWRTYRFPARIIGMSYCGETPPAWKLVKESRDPADIRRKLRQLGTEVILHNFIGEGFPHSAAAPFEWDDRMIGIWKRFVGRHLSLVVRPKRTDHENGGFCVWHLRATPAAADPPYLPYLPGIESAYYEVTKHGLTGYPAGWLNAAARLYLTVPDVDVISDLVASGYYMMKRWEEACIYYKTGVEHGTINDVNFCNMGIAAVYAGRWREGLHLVKRGTEISPYLLDNPAVAILVAQYLAEIEGRIHEGIALARRAVKAKPGDVPALGALSFLLLRAGELDEAAAALRLAKDALPAVAGDPEYATLIRKLKLVEEEIERARLEQTGRKP